MTRIKTSDRAETRTARRHSPHGGLSLSSSYRIVGILNPDIGIPNPDIGILNPDIGIPNPDIGILDPDIGIPNPDIGIPNPDLAIQAGTMPAPILPVFGMGASVPYGHPSILAIIVQTKNRYSYPDVGEGRGGNSHAPLPTKEVSARMLSQCL